jgi:hypothetical protein
MTRLITHAKQHKQKVENRSKRQADGRFFEFEEGKQQTKIGKGRQTIPRYFRELYSILAGKEGEMRTLSFPRVSQRKKNKGLMRLFMAHKFFVLFTGRQGF